MAPKFTQRHYIVVAELFREAKKPLDEATEKSEFLLGAEAEWKHLQMRFAEVFEADNPRTEKNHPFGFKPEIFDRACGRT